MVEQLTSYVNILIESLNRKKRYLEDVLKLTNKQTILAYEENFQEDKFDEILDQKDILINNINEIDKGFSSIYERIRMEINLDKELYKPEIKIMQEQIKKCVELGMEIQVVEGRNKSKLEQIFSNSFKSIRTKANSNRVSKSYISTMANGQIFESNFYDRKK